jgi:acyl carrier protein
MPAVRERSPNRLARIEQEIVSFLSEKGATRDRLNPATDLLAAGILDSLLVMSLIAHVENAYCIRLESDDVSPANFRTPASLAALIDTRRCA